jgi:hypothetical protein
MEPVLPRDNQLKSQHQTQPRKAASLAEMLDNCSVEVLEAVLMVLRSRATAANPPRNQPGQQQSRQKESPF